MPQSFVELLDAAATSVISVTNQCLYDVIFQPAPESVAIVAGTPILLIIDVTFNLPFASP